MPCDTFFLQSTCTGVSEIEILTLLSKVHVSEIEDLANLAMGRRALSQVNYMSPSLSSSASLCRATTTMQENKSIKLWNELSSACNPAMPSSTELEATRKFTPHKMVKKTHQFSFFSPFLFLKWHDVHATGML